MFGGFSSCAVTKQTENVFDPMTFTFSFESHGRCMTPRKIKLMSLYQKHVYISFTTGYRGCYVEFGKQYGFKSAFTLWVDRHDSRCESLWALFQGPKTPPSPRRSIGMKPHATTSVMVSFQFNSFEWFWLFLFS